MISLPRASTCPRSLCLSSPILSERKAARGRHDRHEHRPAFGPRRAVPRYSQKAYSIMTEPELPPHLREVVEQARLALEAIETEPDAATLAVAPVLDLWQPVFTGPRLCLTGLVDGHPLLPSDWVTTSPLLVLDPDFTWARTYSRYYRLGTPLESSLSAAFGQRLAILRDATGGPVVTLDAVRDHLAGLHDMIRTIAEH